MVRTLSADYCEVLIVRARAGGVHNKRRICRRHSKLDNRALCGPKEGQFIVRLADRAIIFFSPKWSCVVQELISVMALLYKSTKAFNYMSSMSRAVQL